MIIKLIHKLASLYLLKSVAMDIEQARQILGLPENATKSEVMFAYKKQMHKLYMQTGQYQKVPVLDEARDSLMQNQIKPIIEEHEVQVPITKPSERPEENIKPIGNLYEELSKRINTIKSPQFEIHTKIIDRYGDVAYSKGAIESPSISEIVYWVDKKITSSNLPQSYKETSIYVYNDVYDFQICKVIYNFDTGIWYADFSFWTRAFPDTTWEEFKPILLKL